MDNDQEAREMQLPAWAPRSRPSSHSGSLCQLAE
jgi:hypothetical protein